MSEVNIKFCYGGKGNQPCSHGRLVGHIVTPAEEKRAKEQVEPKSILTIGEDVIE